MLGRPPKPFSIDQRGAEQLRAVLRDKAIAAPAAGRAFIVLARAQGLPPQDIAQILGHNLATVYRVCERYQQRGLKSLHDAERSGRPPIKRAARPAPTGRARAARRAASRR